MSGGCAERRIDSNPMLWLLGKLSAAWFPIQDGETGTRLEDGETETGKPGRD
jgi:hypothetical protein